MLVVGAGPAGLSMAILLRRLGLDAMVVERRGGVNPHPRARSVNVRTAEIMRQWGVLDDIEAVSLPLPWTEQFVYCETLAGTEIGRVTTGVQPVVGGVELSPAPWLLTSQDRIEEILLRHLLDHPQNRPHSHPQHVAEAQVCWDTELVEVAQDGDHVTAEVRGPSGTRHLTARWLVGADGAASAVRRSLGIEMTGIPSFGTMINCQFYADLGPWTDHRPAALYWTTSPARNVFQKIDTDDRWLCQINYDPSQHQPEDFTVDTAAEWIRRSIGADLPEDFDLRVTDVIPWVMSSTVAERFRVGQVFLIGDAAHQLPPTGGFGMNTAVQDAHNLAWKLAAVADGHAGEALLDTYETERAPIAQYNADRSRENSRSVGRIRRLIESGTATVEERRAALESSARYGNWLGMDLGLHYEEGCLIPDGTEPPPADDPVSDYVPTARPGHRAPHQPIRRDGTSSRPSRDPQSTLSPVPQSTLDLYDTQFVLLCGAEVDLEAVAAPETGETETGLGGADGAPPTVGPGIGPVAGAGVGAASGDVGNSAHPALRVLRLGADLPDPDGGLAAAHGIGRHGAVLVRPDGHVAWRDPASAKGALDAFDSLLCRSPTG